MPSPLFPGETTEEAAIADLEDGNTLLVCERGTIMLIGPDYVIVKITSDGTHRRLSGQTFTRILLNS